MFQIQNIEIADAVADDHVRIEVHAFGINFADILMREGLYPEAPPPPFTPGYEISGVVIAVGSAVSGFSVGDRVCAMTKFGGYATCVDLPVHQVLPLPAHVSLLEGAAIPVNFLTAWCALIEMSRVCSDDVVYIPNGAGGVGLAAIQIAKLHGARVIASASRAEKFQIMRDFGADHVMTYEEEHAYLDANLVDIILDADGGSKSKYLFSRLKPIGRLVHFGNASMIPGGRKNFFSLIRSMIGLPFYHPVKLMMNNRGVFGLNMLKFFDNDPDLRVARAGRKIMELFFAGKLRVHVGGSYDFESVGEAHSALKSRALSGKAVVKTLHFKE